jgi:hypothetical protein
VKHLLLLTPFGVGGSLGENYYLSPLEGALTLGVSMSEMKKLWADEDATPDINNEEPQSLCDPTEFDVLPHPVHVVIKDLMEEWETITVFLDSGGVIQERIFPNNTTCFVAYRKMKLRGYGKTPKQAITNWAFKTRESEES